MSKITQIPGTGDELRAAMEQLRRSLPIMAEMAVEVAKIRRVMFDAYVAEGFTEEQSLELCKTLAL